MITEDVEKFAEEMTIAGLEAFELGDGVYDMLNKIARSLIALSNRVARIEHAREDV